MKEVDENLAAAVAQGLSEITEAYSEDVGHKPTGAELFEILSLALKSGSEFELDDIHPANIIALKPEIRRSMKPHSSAGPKETEHYQSGVADLNDNTFVVTSNFIFELIKRIRQNIGRNPTISEFTKALAQGLHRSNDDLLADVTPKEIIGVNTEIRKQGRIPVQVGDIVAIPAENDKYFIGVVLVKNKYGTAYGFFEGTSPLKSFSAKSHPPIIQYPIYSSDEFVATGRWKVIGNDAALRSLFPADPEIYYRKQVIPGAEKLSEKIGPYGSARTVTGVKRDLTLEEAEKIGLLDNTYQQFYLPEALEQFLQRKLQRRE